jgi:hypothetical protein
VIQNPYILLYFKTNNVTSRDVLAVTTVVWTGRWVLSMVRLSVARSIDGIHYMWV